MGAEQSSAHNASDNKPAKRCYYEVLDIERNASDDEIKKAYRRKALELHPDRNYGDVENATNKFAEVQSAYEILSDAQERAWYDSHRESIMRGDDGLEGDKFESSANVTSSSDIVSLMSRFNSKVPFTDAPGGFFGSLRSTFARIADEEYSAGMYGGIEAPSYPDFGTSEADYDEVVKPFYRDWVNFSTVKEFSWRDAYKSSSAPDRATRRLIDKENKRLREEGIREFNDSVRSLVTFVRKRDPRYIPNSQSEAERQRILRGAALAQAARSRAANQAKLEQHVEQDWAKSHQAEEEGIFEESDQSQVEHIECVVCGKIFKSEKQYEAHEKSKKHIKAVQQLQREMRKENKRLNLDTTASSEHSPPVSTFEALGIGAEDEPSEVLHFQTDKAEELDSHDLDQGLLQTDITLGASVRNRSHDSDATESSAGDFDEYASREEVEARLQPGMPTEDDTPATESSGPRLGKAKLKRAKKIAKQEPSQEGQEFNCVSCNESFQSKNMLFNHIKANPSHARPLPKLGKGKKKSR